MKFLSVLFLTTLGSVAFAAPNNSETLPANLGLGLRQLAALDQTAAHEKLSSTTSIMSDAADRVIVNIYSSGTTSLADLQKQLTTLGVEIIGVETQWRRGVISAWLPIAQVTTVANLAGVKSVMLAPRPIRRAGSVTAESSIVEHAADVNAAGNFTAQGILGRNISIGIVSDSFDTSSKTTRASVGIASGDLPGAGNPEGYSTPVFVLRDGTSSDGDEGRAMAEVVHDIAPAAKISFSAAGATQSTMAASIRNLRTSSQTLCDIIVDDIGYPDEPFFSDGAIAQAIEDVATSSALAGKKVSYFSAAGNNIGAYSADANIISPANAQQYFGNVVLTNVPSSLYTGGFQNFGTSSAPVVVTTITTDAESSHELVLQWDDPFDARAVTTDYNLLVFDQNGHYQASLSGTDDNVATDEPLEIVDLGSNQTYQIMISVRSSSPTARHLRLLEDDGNTVTGPYISNDAISIFGHATAADANAVGAYVYSNTPNTVSNYNSAGTNPPPGPYTPAPEDFSARGGSVPFYFDAQGNRLSSPQFRLKPEFAAADGVDTSFFPTGSDQDYDNDGFPNFFGTSAAAPNAAAFAALMLEAAGGPGSLTPAQIRAKLEQTAMPHDLNPNFSNAIATGGTATVTLSASGDESNASAMSPTFFNLTFAGQSGETLNQIVIDLTNTGLVFDASADKGLPFVVGQNSGGVSVSETLSPDNRILTLNFGSSFIPGDSISFGIDRDFAGINASGNSADSLAGASVIATIDSSRQLFSAFANQLGSGFASRDGYGLLDAKAAVASVLGRNVTTPGVPANLSTRGEVGTGDNVLIGGVIVTGSSSKKVIFRAIGPSLANSGIANPLADPALDLYNANGQQIATDDNWQDDSAQAAQIQASGIPPNDPRESALVETLAPGAYTAIVRPANANVATGTGLVEVYDLDAQPAASHLANISTRGLVQTADNVLIGGFILNQGSSEVIARALGPSLANAGVANVLADPMLEIHDSQGNVIATNDNWQQDSGQATRIQQAGLAPANASESAIDLSLASGPYTTVVRGAQGTTGIALVEVYNLQ